MDIIKDVPVGASGSISLEVTKEMTASHQIAHLPAVYSTPQMIALIEGAAEKAVAPHLPEGWISVGLSVNIKHLAATPVGFTVTATAKITSVSEHTITCEVEAHDGEEKIGEGIHVRAPIDLSRFEKRLAAKVAKKDS